MCAGGAVLALKIMNKCSHQVSLGQVEEGVHHEDPLVILPLYLPRIHNSYLLRTQDSEGKDIL